MSKDLIRTKDSKENIRLLLIGAGRAGSMLLRLFGNDLSLDIAGVADVNPDAPGLKIAREMGIPTCADYQKLLRDKHLDLIINVSGRREIQQDILANKPLNAEVIGGLSAKLFWTVLTEFRKKEIHEETFELMRMELERLSVGEFIVGRNPRMQEILELITKVAHTPTTVLIRGESGTGKELVARMIHRNSLQKEKPMVTVNCTALSAQLIESELFGYRKGAFTGATSDRTGLLELANDSTIFLDEIGDMPMEMQSKLLRFLQSGEVRAIGDTVTRTVKVRVIAATNRQLEEAMKTGEFRNDLFYRLNAFTIQMPPLRERSEDIPLLAFHFLKSAQAKVNKRVDQISPAALSALVHYPWPGNLRELENVIEDNSGGFMEMKAQVIDKFEYEAVCRYLTEQQGNVTRAADAANIPRRTFQRLMAKHKIDAELFR
ncbi:MAG: sigma 54-interacting transcriptional regulator [Calditrichia bacterium]